MANIERRVDVAEATSIAEHFYKSGFFADARDLSKAVTKIAFGMGIGLDPFSAMQGVILVQGRPTLSAGLMARLIKSSGKYRYTIDQLDEKVCTVTLYEKVELSSTTWEWFKHAPVTRKIEEYRHLMSNDTWRKYPRNMLFARTISDVAKMLCADVFGGSVYLPDEIPGGNVKVDGETLEANDALFQSAAVNPAGARKNFSAAIEAEVVETRVVAEEERIRGLVEQLTAAGLGLPWVWKTLGLGEPLAGGVYDLSPEQATRVEKALVVFRQANNK